MIILIEEDLAIHLTKGTELDDESKYYINEIIEDYEK